FLDVVVPALLTLLAGADEVAALGVVLQMKEGGVEGEAAEGGGQGEDGAGEPADRSDQGDQAAANESRLVRGRLCGIHAFRLPLEFRAAPRPWGCGPRRIVGRRSVSCKAKGRLGTVSMGPMGLMGLIGPIGRTEALLI